VFLFATLDSKGREAAYVRDLLVSWGIPVTLVDVSAIGIPSVEADVPRTRVYERAGTSLESIQRRADRGEAVTKAADGAAEIAREAYARGELAGVLSIGGSAGTTIGTSAMRALPLGVPKVMLSTLASGMVRQYVRDKDIVMLNSVVDILGLNRISREVLSQAARVTAGLVRFPGPTRDSRDDPGTPDKPDKPLIAATMFGVTTKCVERARATLERAGCEVLVFHATGNGGQAMESLVGEGLIAGVLDITTTELADEYVGGFLTAGPDRLEAAGKAGIPQVVSTGALDMVNFYAPESVPAKFTHRRFYQHNPNVTLMRTSPEECAAIGAVIARKLSAASGSVSVLLPGRGVSAIDKEGQPFDDPAARRALHDAIRSGLRGVEAIELDLHINDEAFADAAAQKLLDLMNRSQPARERAGRASQTNEASRRSGERERLQGSPRGKAPRVKR
jgi:uncharacterized protein (UPF0261 family)